MSWLRKLFGKPKNTGDAAPSHTSGQLPGELWFNSGKDAVEYIGKFMQTDWRTGSLVMGMVCSPSLSECYLTARVLIPDGSMLQDVLCISTLERVVAPEGLKLDVTPDTAISEIGIQSGDLVSVYLGGEAPASVRAAWTWWGVIVAVNEPCYSLKRSGWKIKRQFEISSV